MPLKLNLVASRSAPTDACATALTIVLTCKDCQPNKHKSRRPHGDSVVCIHMIVVAGRTVLADTLRPVTLCAIRFHHRLEIRPERIGRGPRPPVTMKKLWPQHIPVNIGFYRCVRRIQFVAGHAALIVQHGQMWLVREPGKVPLAALGSIRMPIDLIGSIGSRIDRVALHTAARRSR